MINFTTRQKEVSKYLVTGTANKEIAEALGVQVVTIKMHVRAICQRLGVKNRTQAALALYRISVANGEFAATKQDITQMLDKHIWQIQSMLDDKAPELKVAA